MKAASSMRKGEDEGGRQREEGGRSGSRSSANPSTRMSHDDATFGRLVDEGEALLDGVIKKEIREAESKKQGVFEELMHVRTLLNNLQLLKNSPQPFEALVDVGCDAMMQAEVTDTSQLFVSVGFGFFLQMTTEEATVFLKKKEKLLQCQLDHCLEKSATAKCHLQTLLDALSEALFRGGDTKSIC